MKSIILMGPPGSGKTTMYVKTLPPDAYPVLAIDIDRKLQSMDIAKPLIESGKIKVWELDEPLNEMKLAARLKAMAENKKPDKAPKGWTKFCDFAERLETHADAKASNTIVIDSATILGAHMMRTITHHDPAGHATLGPRDWGYYLMMWQETMTEFLDYCKRTNKNLIICVHQRVGEIPGENNKVIKTKGEGGVVNREYIGTLQVKVVPSIQGQFGLEMGAYVEEFYGLDVVMEKDKPKWVCRVLPDGRRDLRTSVAGLTEAEFEPDFRQIWGVTPKKESRP